MANGERELPRPTPETQHFWDGTREGELRIQQCGACDNVYFPPRHFCPGCGSKDVSILKASGKATLHSYVISHLPAPGFEPPYAIAVAKLDEGPKMMTNVINVEPDPAHLKPDMALEIVYDDVTDEVTLPKFQPAG